jgi:hypothetical protein
MVMYWSELSYIHQAQTTLDSSIQNALLQVDSLSSQPFYRGTAFL